jgi:hypothetical protein
MGTSPTFTAPSIFPHLVAARRGTFIIIVINVSTRAQHPVVLALYLNAALLGAIVIILLDRNSGPSILPSAMAQNAAPIGGASGCFIMPGQFAEKSWGCYLLDVDSQTLCAYEYFPGEKQLRLIAARNFKYDRKLSNFNTDRPTPSEVKDLLDKEAMPVRTGAPQ